MKLKQSNNKKLLSPFISPFLSSSLQRPQEDIDMDWSSDIPQAPTSPSLHVPPASEHILSPHALLHNKDPNSKNSVASAVPSVLDYGKDQLAISSS